MNDAAAEQLTTDDAEEALDRARAASASPRPRQRFQAATRGTKRRLVYGTFATREERDEAMRRARAGEIDPLYESVGSVDTDDPYLLTLSPTREPTPERRVIAALLLGAWEDLHGPRKRRSTTARAWIESCDPSAFAFEFCCHALGVDVATTRAKLLAHTGAPSRRVSTVRARLRLVESAR